MEPEAGFRNLFCEPKIPTVVSYTPVLETCSVHEFINWEPVSGYYYTNTKCYFCLVRHSEVIILAYKLTINMDTPISFRYPRNLGCK
jgi:hypothetical protein